MKTGALRALTALALAGALFVACSGDKTSQTPARLSKRGETCQSSNDCDTSLVCVQGRCSVGSYSLTPTGKQCVLVACHEPADCCPPPQPNCAQLQQLCEGGLTFDCTQYMALCACDGSRFACTDGKCVSAQPCVPSDGFTLDTCQAMGMGMCVAGKCVQCAKDADCPPTGNLMKTCKDNKCQIKCAKDGDCDPFYKCDTAATTCVYAGCKTKLECVSKTGNPLAECRNTECAVPCQSDPECGSTVIANPVQGVGTPVASGLQVCVLEGATGHCVDVGCESDDQCRILNRIPGGSRTSAECRPAVKP